MNAIEYITDDETRYIRTMALAPVHDILQIQHWDEKNKHMKNRSRPIYLLNIATCMAPNMPHIKEHPELEGKYLDPEFWAVFFL